MSMRDPTYDEQFARGFMLMTFVFVLGSIIAFLYEGIQEAKHPCLRYEPPGDRLTRPRCLQRQP